MSKNIIHFELLDHEQVRVSRIEEKHTSKYFPTHRHRYYELVIITSCSEDIFSHNIDFISYPLKAGRIYSIAPGQAHGWNIETYNKEYKGYLVTFNESFLLTGDTVLEQNLFKLFNPLNMTPYLEFNPALFSQTFPTMSILEEEYNKKETDFYLLRSLLETLIHYLAKLKFQNTPRLMMDCQRLVNLRKEIEINYKKEKNVDFYARKIDLSAKRLNEITKDITGETVTQILHHRLLLEAKREIVSGTKTIQSISEDLGFENPSYFSRFFKKYEGLSPTAFSNKMFK